MILIIDNFDSFTYNVAQAFGELGEEVTVVRNNAMSAAQVAEMKPKAVIISPGPGRPEDGGISLEVIDRYKGEIPIMGVCLGHQCIGQVMGGRVIRAAQPIHGKTWEVYHDGRGLFAGLRNPFVATRYHSLIVEEDSLPESLEVSSFTAEGEVMGLSNRELMLEGVQFHPESIGTAAGQKIFRNFLDMYCS